MPDTVEMLLSVRETKYISCDSPTEVVNIIGVQFSMRVHACEGRWQSQVFTSTPRSLTMLTM
jgi:hypothetical protein